MKKPYIFFVSKLMKKEQELQKKKRKANVQLIEAITDKWETISDAIMASTAESGVEHIEELTIHLRNVSEMLTLVRKNDFQRSDFEELEIFISHLEQKIDRLAEDQLITLKLWELINYSLTNFIEFVSYLMISSGK